MRSSVSGELLKSKVDEKESICTMWVICLDHSEHSSQMNDVMFIFVHFINIYLRLHHSYKAA